MPNVILSNSEVSVLIELVRNQDEYLADYEPVPDDMTEEQVTSYRLVLANIARKLENCNVART